MALATTLGDLDLLKNSIKSNIAGSLIALIFSIMVGILFNINPKIPELFSRTQVGMGDVVLALASGSAGALSFTMGLPSALIGVMVAVALLPPLVTFGMLLGLRLSRTCTGGVIVVIS